MNKLVAALIGVALLALLVRASTFSVSEREYALVFAFGQLKEVKSEPGLYFKLPPPFQNVVYLDRRILTIDTPTTDLVQTSEKKNLLVDSFVKWRIVDPRRFWVSFQGSERAAEDRVGTLLRDVLNQAVNKRTVNDITSRERDKAMQEIAEALQARVQDLGVEIVDVRLKRVDFSPEISESVYRRMEAERKRVASEERSKGSAEAEKIRADAERAAFEEVKRKNTQAQKIRQEADDEARKILSDAGKKAAELEGDIKARVAETQREAFEKGVAEGREQGYTEGKAEAGRLVERLHTILTKAIEKRNEIIQESETQIINLVLLIVKKVIKVISENQKNVVINNVVQALRKLRSRGDVVIRVNLADLQLTSEHVKDFMKMVENVKSITVLEDSSVDKGGCIIETDFGQIDGRVSSQLHEIEEKILELMPIRAKGE